MAKARVIIPIALLVFGAACTAAYVRARVPAHDFEFLIAMGGVPNAAFRTSPDTEMIWYDFSRSPAEVKSAVDAELKARGWQVASPKALEGDYHLEDKLIAHFSGQPSNPAKSKPGTTCEIVVSWRKGWFDRLLGR